MLEPADKLERGLIGAAIYRHEGNLLGSGRVVNVGGCDAEVGGVQRKVGDGETCRGWRATMADFSCRSTASLMVDKLGGMLCSCSKAIWARFSFMSLGRTSVSRQFPAFHCRTRIIDLCPCALGRVPHLGQEHDRDHQR